ncbi:MAG TPA: hypothetical protein VFV67_31925 [Actinophytocola sp.]|uniref:hypothetical protein n=1 Tax=Actinophytocola sp. TaxID=1872138 RepID=UPI002DBFCE7A|nr:hypothetical protein [Actinophytocola sp.]HEU5475276.1 hypothetical protein [Actinophytocola sp.]
MASDDATLPDDAQDRPGAEATAPADRAATEPGTRTPPVAAEPPSDTESAAEPARTPAPAGQASDITPPAPPTAVPTDDPLAEPPAEPTAAVTPPAEPAEPATGNPPAEPPAAVTPPAGPTAASTDDPLAEPPAEHAAVVTPPADPATGNPPAEPPAAVTPPAQPSAVPTDDPLAEPPAQPTAAVTPAAAPADPPTGNPPAEPATESATIPPADQAAWSQDWSVAVPPATDPAQPPGAPQATWPESGFPPPPEVPRRRRSWRKVWLSLGAAAVVVLLLVVGYTGVRLLMDNGAYADGREAYERADCATAVAEYDSVINGYRIVTIGDTVRLAESEKAECQAFRVAADKQQAGDRPGALVSYVKFVPDRPTSPLTEAARTRVTELLEAPGIATLESCDVLDLLRRNKMLGPDNGPGIHSACGTAFAEAHDLSRAVVAYARLFTDYPDNRIAAETEELIAKDLRWCTSLPRVRDDRVLSARGELLPNLLANCATAAANVNDLDSKEAAEEFLKKYPGHARTAEVTAAFARLLNKIAREDGRELGGSPQAIGRAGPNEAVILLHNDSAELLRIALAGAQARVETVDACPTCPPSPKAENNICRDQAVLKRIVVTAGEYDVAFTHGDNESRVRDSFAHWNLRGGTEYFVCIGTITEQG